MDYTLAENQIVQRESETAVGRGYLGYYQPMTTPEPYRSRWLIDSLPIGKVLRRLSDPLYGRDILDTQLDEMAAAAPGIEQVWKITESWPSLTKLLLEERNNE